MKKGEKRRHPRFPIEVDMEVHAAGHTVSRPRGTIMDLSTGGMAFKTNADLEEGATLYLKVNIPFIIRGQVRHMKPDRLGLHQYGVRFHKIGFAGARERGSHFIAARFHRLKGRGRP